MGIEDKDWVGQFLSAMFRSWQECKITRINKKAHLHFISRMKHSFQRKFFTEDYRKLKIIFYETCTMSLW